MHASTCAAELGPRLGRLGNGHQVDHRSLGQVNRLVDHEVTAFDSCSKCLGHADRTAWAGKVGRCALGFEMPVFRVALCREQRAL